MARSSATRIDDIATIATRCVTVLRQRPAGLVTDIDGTISEIAPSPDAAKLADGARDALTRLLGVLDLVAVVSGRSVTSARAMVDIPAVIAVGNHGFEWFDGRSTTPIDGVAEFVPAIASALARIDGELERRGLRQGVLLENKRYTASVHYRLAPEPVETERALRDIVPRIAGDLGLVVSPGRMVIEIRPPLVVNKGTAVERLVANRQLKSMVFLGDDVTDIDGFQAVARLRNGGRLEGLNVAVIGGEVIERVRAAADAGVDGVAACVTLLGAIADGLQAEMM